MISPKINLLSLSLSLSLFFAFIPLRDQWAIIKRNETTFKMMSQMPRASMLILTTVAIFVVISSIWLSGSESCVTVKVKVSYAQEISWISNKLWLRFLALKPIAPLEHNTSALSNQDRATSSKGLGRWKNVPLAIFGKSWIQDGLWWWR